MSSLLPNVSSMPCLCECCPAVLRMVRWSSSIQKTCRLTINTIGSPKKLTSCSNWRDGVHRFVANLDCQLPRLWHSYFSTHAQRARILKTNTVADLANWQPGCSRRSNRVLIRPLELLSNVDKKPLAIRLRARPQNALRVHSCG